MPRKLLSKIPTDAAASQLSLSSSIISNNNILLQITQNEANMFAVKGWSVPTSALKTQTTSKPDATLTPVPTAESGAVVRNDQKKRKRKDKAEVNDENLADLWESVIEKKTKLAPAKEEAKETKPVNRAEKRQKISKEKAAEEDIIMKDAEPAATETPVDVKSETGEIKLSERGEKRKAAKEKKREKKKADAATGTKPATPTAAAPNTLSAPPVAAKVEPKLTPLQASMRQKLISARFRHLNQTLYTTPSSHSLSLFSDNPEMFHEYHEGFRRQVEVWPENPVDTYIQQIQKRGKVKALPRGQKASDADPSPTALLPLPRTEGTCYIADLGCGDAMLTQKLELHKKKLKVQVFSYDLQNPSPFVTKADIANLPLEDNSCDVAIFCLALMGTNWIDFIEEAYRILHWKGELWVAEIKSRFGRVSGKNKRVEHSVGNRKKPDKKTLKKMEEAADDADLLVEVDGHDDNSGETDVSAFVEVLRKRGFVLQNDHSVDLSNRMFVKMTFVKALIPMKGKCVPVPEGMDKMLSQRDNKWKPKPGKKFTDAEKKDDENTVSSEASVLKPCVYKLR